MRYAHLVLKLGSQIYLQMREHDIGCMYSQGHAWHHMLDQIQCGLFNPTWAPLNSPRLLHKPPWIEKFTYGLRVKNAYLLSPKYVLLQSTLGAFDFTLSTSATVHIINSEKLVDCRSTYTDSTKKRHWIPSNSFVGTVELKKRESSALVYAMWCDTYRGYASESIT